MELPQHYSVAASAQPQGHIQLTADSLPALQSAAPKEFGGPGGFWSPEDLLIAAVADCFALSFRAIAAASKFEWTSLQCSASGKLDKLDRAIQFTELTLTATLKIPAGGDESRAMRLLEKAEQTCFITNSLKATARLDANVIAG
jgi:organic hydroperoxide reductase OsmC/OhrA